MATKKARMESKVTEQVGLSQDGSPADCMKQNMHEMFTAADTIRCTFSAFSGRDDRERASTHTGVLASLVLSSWHWDMEKESQFLG